MRKADGVTNYSSPNGMHVLFCADAQWRGGLLDDIFTTLGIPFEKGEGSYQGVIEPVYAIEYGRFWSEVYVKIKPFIEQQETFLILGHLLAMNWRHADLYYQATGEVKRMGTWKETGNVRGHTGWSKFHGHYFIVKNNPAPDRGTQIERYEAQMLYDLRNALRDVLGPRLNQAQGQLLFKATQMLKGKTLVDGTKLLGP
jgi:hypothetical protein